MTSEVELRSAVLDRYRSIHAFCRAHPELKRATVYLVLSGRYPGNVSQQAVRIQTALTGAPPERSTDPVTAEEIAAVVQADKCNNCRRLDKRSCRDCRTQTVQDARVVERYLASR